MKKVILEPIYRCCRIEEENGHLIKRELIKSYDPEQVLEYAKKEVINGNDINIEVW